MTNLRFLPLGLVARRLEDHHGRNTDRQDGELYGDERLEAVIAECRDSNPEAIAKKILASVESFRGTHPVADDLTLLVLRYQGKGPSSGPA